MPRSTARFISYDLRPAKQSERGILIDLLKIGGDCGLPIRDYRYVGMGANRFYDYLLLHRYLGIRSMVSLEHDVAMFQRAKFNVPYHFIDVRNESVANFLAHDTTDQPELLWLDYDGGIGGHITGDILSSGSRLKVGDYCFVTVFGGPPKAMDALSAADRLVELKEKLGDLAGAVTLADTEKSAFPDAVHKILFAAFKNAFSARRDGKFVPLLQVEYADSLPMITVGGAFLSDGQAASYRARVQTALPFLKSNKQHLYEIRSLHLTEKERVVFDRAVTSPSTRSAERNILKKLGFKDEEIQSYRELLRYLPRYVEAAV